MTAFSNTTLTNQVELDDNEFTNVRFLGAELHYAGGKPPVFANVDFVQSRFVFDGPAMNTIQFLQTMTAENSNMSSIVQGLLPGLKPQAFPTVRPSTMTYHAPTAIKPGPKSES